MLRVVTMQEDLPQASVTSASPASSIRHDLPQQDLLPDQASFTSRAGSNLSTPRSLRTGTVPKLDLSPAIALHMAALEGEEDEDQDADELEEERAAQQQAAIMASFDDLSGPEASDTASQAASEAHSSTASMSAAMTAMHVGDDDAQSTDDLSTASSAASGMLSAHHSGSNLLPSAQQQGASVLLSEAFGGSASGASQDSIVLPAEASHTSSSGLHPAPAVPSALPSVSPATAHAAAAGLEPDTRLHAGISATAGVSSASHAEASAVHEAGISKSPSTDTSGLQDELATALPASNAELVPSPEAIRSLSSASTVSEDLTLEANVLSQEHSATFDNLASGQPAAQAEAAAAAVDISLHHQALVKEAAADTALGADEIQLSFEPANAGHLLSTSALLQADLTATHSPPFLTRSIGKRDSEAEEERHLAPDLLALAEAAMAEADQEAAGVASVSSKKDRQTAAQQTAAISNAQPVPEAARHGQQTDEIAAELFDELLSDAVQAMTIGKPALLHP